LYAYDDLKGKGGHIQFNLFEMGLQVGNEYTPHGAL
jgi:hypothetical protein